MRAQAAVKVWLAVAVWITIYATGTQAAPDLNELLTPELMTPVFNLMRELGVNMRNDVTSKENAEHPDNQFLLVAVLSEGELNQVSERQAFPSAFLEKIGDNTDGRKVEMNRLVFLLNKVKGIDKGLYGKSLHTEVTAIDMEYIKRLKDRFVGDHAQAEYPLILMYSHYIPCYGVPRLPYSCAQEIGNYARGKHDEFGFVVAFTEMFKNTNSECSRQILREAGVLLFEYKDSDGAYERIEDFPHTQRTVVQDQRTLQGDIYNAVVNAIPPTRQCCIGDDANKAKIIAFFVNELTYSCTHNSLKSRRVTPGGKFQLKGCMEAFIKGNLGEDCVNCNNKFLVSKLQKKVCAILESAANDEILLGKPPSTNDLGIYDSSWTPYDGPWSNLYTRAPSDEAHALPSVMCANPMLSKVSLCTKQQDEPGPNDDLLTEGGAFRLRPGLQLAPSGDQLAIEDVVQMRQGVQLEPGQQDPGNEEYIVNLHDTVQGEREPLLREADQRSGQSILQSIRQCLCCCGPEDLDDD